MTISDLSAFRSMVYECPCCSVTLMSDDNGTRSLCDDCQSADCSPNREGCYDDCQRMTETRVLIRTFLSHSDALRGQETDRADGYRVEQLVRLPGRDVLRRDGSRQRGRRQARW